MVLSTTLLPKKERIFSVLVEVYLLENSFKGSVNLNFLIFSCEASDFIIEKEVLLAGQFVS